MEHVKIQINSLEALERLIGGDSQLEFDIRQSVVEAFAQKYLKAVANSTFMQAAAKTVEEHTADKFLINRGWGNYTLGEPLRTKIIEQVNASIAGKISALIEEKLQQHYDNIQSKCDAAAKNITDSITELVLTRKIDALVEQKIKERLGIK